MAVATNDIEAKAQEVQQRVIAALREHGLRELARRLGMHPQTVLAIAAAVPVRRGSLVLAEQYFCRAGQRGDGARPR
jgi:lambda repressor-like predicted transcriptional regulator